MLGTILLINLAGAVALLLWGTHMVSSGVLRGFGTALRNWLGRHLGNRWLALLAGLGITGLLQSLSLIHISEPTRPVCSSRMPSSA